MVSHFRSHGFHELSEQDNWQLAENTSYFVVRDDGSLLAFSVGPASAAEGFRILGAHSDSPCLQIKPLADITDRHYHQLGVEVYGGALLNTWFDRDLSLAGRVCCKTAENTLATVLVDFQRPLLIIPSLAIHLDREANTCRSVNAQQQLPPIVAQALSDTIPDFTTLLREQLAAQHPQFDIAEILGFDIFCYDTQAPCHIGYNKEFICGSRLDNLLSCFVGMTSMLKAQGTANRMFICNNHEEVGSASAAGALGTLPHAVLERLLPDAAARRRCLDRSFFISMDNAHALHPNYADKSDPSHRVLLNRGPVIKTNANQRYATSSRSKAVFKLLAQEVSIPIQEFVMRSDMSCGSTIGPLLAARLGIKTVDVGAPTLAMHSIREVTGSSDPALLSQVILHFLNRQHLPGETS